MTVEELRHSLRNVPGDLKVVLYDRLVGSGQYVEVTVYGTTTVQVKNRVPNATVNPENVFEISLP